MLLLNTKQTKAIVKLLKTVVILLILLSPTSCSWRQLPSSVSPYIQTRQTELAANDNNAESIYSWHGSAKKLRTYWGIKDAEIEVQAYFPSNWEQAGDARWQVEASTKSGEPLPFIGILRRYKNRNNTKLAKIIPPLDLTQVKDGLYIVIHPGVKKSEKGIKKIAPTAYICEIRDQAFQPFRIEIPLIPEEVTAVTPAPVQSEDSSFEGTAFPYD